ncbi:hypothetical protein FKK32_30185 [Klebsiella pneumoniae]|nr:hypothetical protein [Klebsiella pneumoniae]
MWDVAYADGRLSDHERHVMWRIADLLHIPQGAYVHARMRAREAAGLPPERGWPQAPGITSHWRLGSSGIGMPGCGRKSPALPVPERW